MSQSLNQKITVSSIFKFTMPSIIMMIFMSLYTMIDGVFVSRLINTNALSGVNIAYPLISIFVALGTMFGTGLTAIVAKKIGEGKNKEARENFSFVLIVSIIIGLILCFICQIFLKDLVKLLGANDVIYPYALDYLQFLLWFAPISILQLAYQYLFVANGKSNIGLIVTVIGGIANIILDYVFIDIFDMGIAGASIATGIGYCIPAIYGTFYFIVKRNLNIFFVRPKIDWNVLIKSITNGSSEMVTNLAMSITTFLYNLVMVKNLGQDGVAAITMVLYMDFLLVAISLGYSMGVAPLISYNYGCQNHEKTKKIFKISIIFSILLGISTTVLTTVFAEQLISLFTKKGDFVFKLAVDGLYIYSIGYLFKAVNIYSSAMFTAFSNGKVSAILSFARTLFFLVITILGLNYLFGVTGVWFAVPVTEFLSVLLSVFYLIKYKNQYNYI